jgi:Leucine-rich repeat (LRR) protein
LVLPFLNWLWCGCGAYRRDLSGNEIIGSLSHYTLVTLNKLTKLALSNNSITGPFPVQFLREVHPLERLELGGNQLTGTIAPFVLIGLQNLEKM